MTLLPMITMAEIVDGVRQRPTPAQFATFQAGEVFYLYNVQARMFFLGANDWNTRASVGDKGYKVKFVDQGDATPYTGALEFTDSVETKNSWMSVFSTNDGGAIWVDNSGETYRFWNVDVLPNGAYRISNPQLADAGAEAAIGSFMGWNGSEKDTRLYFCKEGAIDWQFITPDTYNAYQETWAAMKDQFEKAAELKTYLERAKEQGIDVAAEEQVYLNEAATVEELEAAILAVQKAIADAAAAGASVENAKDMTGSIVNPNFDNASADGWKGTVPNMVGSGTHGPANVPEHYNKTFDTYQELAGMPKGVYKLEVDGALRTNWDDHANHTNYVAALYAKADGDILKCAMPNFWDAMNTEPMAGWTEWGVEAAEEAGTHDGVTYYIPNDPSAGRLYFEKGFYHNTLFFSVEGNDPLRLGVMKDKKVTSYDWVIFDNFKLTFYGNAPEAYQFWINQLPKNDYSEQTVSEQYLQIYNAAFEVAVSNKAEAMAAVKNIEAVTDSINKNISLWDELVNAVENARLYIIGQYDGLEAAQTLELFVTDLENNVINATKKTQSNAELQALIDMMVEMIDAVVVEYKSQIFPNTDVTEFITNPSFEGKDGNGSTEGWTIESKGGGTVGLLYGSIANNCLEAWHNTSFDVYQNIENLPQGVYEIEVQGYTRLLGVQDVVNKKKETDSVFAAGVPVYVYMNDSRNSLVSWLSYPKPEAFYTAVSGANYLTDVDGNCYPQNAAAATAAFADGGYKQSVKSLVANKDDVLRIGVKGTPEGKFWSVFDNFKLTYLGYAVEVVKPELEKKIAEASTLANTVTTKSAKASFDATYANALEKLESEDGIAMLNALSALTKACNAVEEGAVLCKELEKKINEMIEIAGTAESSHVQEALAYGAQLQGQLDGCELEAEDITAAKDNIRGHILLMQLPENYKEGSTEGLDVTAFIKTPSFEKTVDGKKINSVDGWEGTAGYHFESNGRVEFYDKEFNIYQNVQGAGEVVLPNGCYTVTVNAFERVSDNTPAYLYAETGESKVEVELVKIEVEYPYNTATLLYNSLNNLSIVVTDNKLRLGIKHEKNNTQDWVLMGNFKLTFFGTDAILLKHALEDAILNAAKYLSQDNYSTKSAKAAFNAAYANAVEKQNSEDGAEMLKAMEELTKAISDFKEGKALLDDLLTDVEGMMTIASESNSVVAAEALQFGGEVSSKVKNSELDAEDITLIKLKIREYILSILNFLDVADLNIKVRESNTQEILLKNDCTNLVGFQMDFTLPEGVSIDKTGCTLSSRIKDEEQELKVGKLENGAYRITSTSLSLTPISGNDGTLLTLKLTAEDGCIGGQATINNIIFSTAESEKVIMSDKTFDISILYDLTYKVDGQVYKDTTVAYGAAITPEAEPTKEDYTFGGWSEIPETMPNHDVEITGRFYQYGDVNTDEAVDVVDVVDIARFVVATPSVNFREKLSDLNFDKTVNIADAVTLVNYITGDQDFARVMTPSGESYDYDQCQLQLLSHGTKALSLCLDGTADFTAFQFEVELPENMDVTAVSINGQRKDNHQLLYNKVGENRYCVAALSLSNAVFKGSEGELLNISIDGLNTNEISVQNIHFVTKNGTDITFDALSISGTVTGIANVRNNEGDDVIFDLQGRKLSKVQRGVNIVNGKKVIVNK